MDGESAKARERDAIEAWGGEGDEKDIYWNEMGGIRLRHNLLSDSTENASGTLAAGWTEGGK